MGAATTTEVFWKWTEAGQGDRGIAELYSYKISDSEMKDSSGNLQQIDSSEGFIMQTLGS